MMITAATIVALSFTAQTAPVVVTADREQPQTEATQQDFAPMLNRAAALAMQGDLRQARSIYVAVEKMHAEYKLETVDGRWMYPAEIARRAMRTIDAGGSAALLAVK